MEWSQDSNYVLVSIPKRGVAFVKSLHDPEWQCKLDEGLAGLSSAIWAPQQTHVLTCSDFNLRLTFWNLKDGTMQYVKLPKFAPPKGIAFDKEGSKMALIQKTEENGKDLIGLYSCV